MTKKLNLLLIIFSLAFVSCTDDIIFKEDISSGAADMSELKVSKDFNWSTGRIVEVSIIGLPLASYIVPTKATLYLKNENEVYYSGLHIIDENLNIILVIPSTENSISLKFGSIEMVGTIVKNKIEFSFIPISTQDN